MIDHRLPSLRKCEFCAFKSMIILMFHSIFYQPFHPLHFHRATRTARTETRRAAADENHRQPTRPRHLQCRGSAQTALLQSASRQIAGAAFSQRPRAAAHLLSETGGFGAGAAAHREHVCGEPAVLSKHTQRIVTISSALYYDQQWDSIRNIQKHKHITHTYRDYFTFVDSCKIL